MSRFIGVTAGVLPQRTGAASERRAYKPIVVGIAPETLPERAA